MAGGAVRINARVFEAAGEVDKFLHIARDRHDQGDSRNAAIVYEVVEYKALQVVNLSQDPDTRIKYLNIAIGARDISAGRGHGADLRKMLDSELARKSRIKIRARNIALESQEFNSGMERLLQDAMHEQAYREKNEVVEEFYDHVIDMFDRLPAVQEGVRNTSLVGQIYDIFVGINISSVPARHMEIMSPKEVVEFLDDIHHRAIDIAIKTGCLNIIEREKADDAPLPGLQETPMEGHLATLRHNNLRISMDPLGKVLIVMTNFVSREAEKVATMMDQLGVYVSDKETQIHLLRRI